jgi:hypothetical protein
MWNKLTATEIGWISIRWNAKMTIWIEFAIRTLEMANGYWQPWLGKSCCWVSNHSLIKLNAEMTIWIAFAIRMIEMVKISLFWTNFFFKYYYNGLKWNMIGQEKSPTVQSIKLNAGMTICIAFAIRMFEMVIGSRGWEKVAAEFPFDNSPQNKPFLIFLQWTLLLPLTNVEIVTAVAKKKLQLDTLLALNLKKSSFLIESP